MYPQILINLLPKCLCSLLLLSYFHYARLFCEGMNTSVEKHNKLDSKRNIVEMDCFLSLKTQMSDREAGDTESREYSMPALV
jgi:hypothetical protein